MTKSASCFGGCLPLKFEKAERDLQLISRPTQLNFPFPAWFAQSWKQTAALLVSCALTTRNGRARRAKVYCILNDLVDELKTQKSDFDWDERDETTVS